MHTRRGRFRWRWACTAAAVLVLGIWWASRPYCYTLNMSPRLRFQLLYGYFEMSEISGAPLPEGFFVNRLSGNTKPWAGSPAGQFAVDDLLDVPLMLPFTMFASAAAVLWGMRLRARWKLEVRRELISAGLCPTCRYARHGLANNAPCPECGAAHTQSL